MMVVDKDNHNYILKVIAAEGEHKASSALAQAADVIQESPHALQVLFCIYFLW